MGGHEFGEVASALARDAVVREIRAGRSLSEAIRSADEDIIRQSKRRDDSLPMGTTVVALQVNGSTISNWPGSATAAPICGTANCARFLPTTAMCRN